MRPGLVLSWYCFLAAAATAPQCVSAFSASGASPVAAAASAAATAAVVVVGGGPGGLAAALELRRRLPQTPVVVVERAASLTAFDPERAFLYLIDGRGQKFTDAHHLTDKVRARGVGFDGNAGFNVTVCAPDAPRKVVSLQLLDRTRKMPYWVARNDFVQVLADAVAGDPGICVLAGHACTALRRLPGGGLELEVAPVGLGLEELEGALLLLKPTLVVAADGAKSKVRAALDAWAQADAAAAADADAAAAAAAAAIKAQAPKSVVAKAATFAAAALSKLAPQRSYFGTSTSSRRAAHGRRFALAARPSPSAGLRYKVLALPGGFPLDLASATAEAAASADSAESAATPTTTATAAAQAAPRVERAVPTMTYSFRSRADVGLTRACRLGVLPRPAWGDARTANLITAPDHALWTDPALRTAEGMAAFLAESFPQLPLAQAFPADGAAFQAEVARFAASPGGFFPAPTTTRGGVVYCWPPPQATPPPLEQPASSSLSSDDRPNPSFVALLGDALHFFPPDVGQGVNSALDDALALGQCLGEQEIGPSSADLSAPLSSPQPPPLSSAAAALPGVKVGAVDWARVGRGLDTYEATRAPEAAALVEIVQVANPFQYAQTGGVAKLRTIAWGLNFVLRRFLARLPLVGAEASRPRAPRWALFHEPLFVLVQRGDTLPYADALRQAHKTTTVLRAAALSALCAAALLAARCILLA